MKPIKYMMNDVLRHQYTLLLHCPFIQQTQLKVIVSEDSASKSVYRPDLNKVIDEEWNSVHDCAFWYFTPRCY